MPDEHDGDLADRIQQGTVARARRRVAALKGLYIHASIYVVVMIGLVVVDWMSGEGWWAHWVALGWGIGLVSHAVAVYFDTSDRVARWEDRKVKEILRSYERRQPEPHPPIP